MMEIESNEEVRNVFLEDLVFHAYNIIPVSEIVAKKSRMEWGSITKSYMASMQSQLATVLQKRYYNSFESEQVDVESQVLGEYGGVVDETIKKVIKSPTACFLWLLCDPSRQSDLMLIGVSLRCLFRIDGLFDDEKVQQAIESISYEEDGLSVRQVWGRLVLDILWEYVCGRKLCDDDEMKGWCRAFRDYCSHFLARSEMEEVLSQRCLDRTDALRVLWASLKYGREREEKEEDWYDEEEEKRREQSKALRIVVIQRKLDAFFDSDIVKGEKINPDLVSLVNLAKALNGIESIPYQSEQVRFDCIRFWMGWSFEVKSRVVGHRKSEILQRLCQKQLASFFSEIPLPWWLSHFSYDSSMQRIEDLLDQELLTNSSPEVEELVLSVQCTQYVSSVPLDLFSRVDKEAIRNWLLFDLQSRIVTKNTGVNGWPLLLKILFWLRVQMLDDLGVVAVAELLAEVEGRDNKNAPSAVIARLAMERALLSAIAKEASADELMQDGRIVAEKVAERVAER
jgi:hypothetical protein